MLWEGKPLRDVKEADIRQLVESGLEEHMQLEYKSELYKGSDNGKREFLLDVCMFANANGGILLIGIPERRDEKDQPTGAPDPTGILGVEIDNPGAVLATYDASVTDSIALGICSYSDRRHKTSCPRDSSAQQYQETTFSTA